MKKKCIYFFMMIFFILIFFKPYDVHAQSYLSDKTEIVVDLDVSGAEALAQTSDGYVWIGQYSGLTRYDSKEFITFKSFEEDGTVYEILNVRALKQLENKLFILTYKHLFLYEDNKFSYINLNVDKIINEIEKESNEKVNFQLLDLELDSVNKILYASTTIGLFTYDITSRESGFLEVTKNKTVNDVAYDKNRDTYYYQLTDGVYNENNELIYSNPKVLEIYCYEDVLLIGTTTGCVRYDLIKNKLADIQYDFINDQVNKFLYHETYNTLYVACENNKGLKNAVYTVDVNTHEYSSANNISNNKQLVDMMIDYEGNLWVASHNVSSSGVSIITKNALTDLLIDDPIWQEYEKNEEISKQVNAVERINDILYICTFSGLIEYDLESKKIIPEDGTKNPIMQKLDELNLSSDIRDVELFNNKIYFAVYQVGLLEYDLETENIQLYGIDFVNDDSKVSITSKEGEALITRESLVNLRSLRAFDNFLAIGYQKGGIIKFDGEKYKVFHDGQNVLFINQTPDGKVLFDQTQGLFTINDDFTEVQEYITEKNVDGNRLKFLVDDNKVFYTLNSRLFYNDYDNPSVSKEVVVPYIKGSIVELSKVKIKNNNGTYSYNYVIASTSQIYITNSLSEDNLDIDGKLINYELYDSTNGLQTIAANTSGYYDSLNYKYYFQTTDGIFVYTFTSTKDDTVPIKIALSSIDASGKKFFEDNFTISKNANRISFNLSILAFRPNKGYKVYYKLDGVDKNYIELIDDTTTISYTNLKGGDYKFHAYVLDEYGQRSNDITVTFVKPKQFYEQVWFWVFVVILIILGVVVFNYVIITNRIKKAVEREQEYRAITLESIEAIARTIDAKDTYTNGHSKRVGIYSREIARALNLSQDEIDNIYYIALLHDIGKISIPLEILNKPGRLTDEEFDVMKTHTTAGAKILEGISTIPHIVEGAKYHHERFGGGGYPTGIKGEEIPFIARIICCADCYDAMATKRTYKEPYSKEKIISEFERCKGSQFDPNIADVVIKLIKEDRLRYGIQEKKKEE